MPAVHLTCLQIRRELQMIMGNLKITCRRLQKSYAICIELNGRIQRLAVLESKKEHVLKSLLKKQQQSRTHEGTYIPVYLYTGVHTRLRTPDVSRGV